MIPEVDVVRMLRAGIRDIPDFPTPGVVFKDITPMLTDPAAFAGMVEALAAPLAGRGITKLLAVEARGFIPGAAMAPVLGAGFVPVRKAGKLPWEVERAEYVLEYGTDLLEVHRDAIDRGERVAIVDDVLATGGTAAAAVRLARALGGEVVACSFLIELTFLRGRAQLPDLEVNTLITYD
ncbi:MAG: adenine phosphoribosyltransferase [Acidimicrobiales bacterium]